MDASPSGLVTVTPTVPEACRRYGGQLSGTDELDVGGRSGAELTVAPELNPLPPIATCCPPAVVPEDGLTDVTVGGEV